MTLYLAWWRVCAMVEIMDRAMLLAPRKHLSRFSAATSFFCCSRPWLIIDREVTLPAIRSWPVSTMASAAPLPSAFTRPWRTMPDLFTHVEYDRVPGACSDEFLRCLSRER